MKRRQIQTALALLLAVLLLLSSCALAANPPASQSVPQTETAQTAPETSSDADKSTAASIPETTAAPKADFTVQFSTAYGEAPAPQAVNKKEKLKEPEAVSVPGKTFEGWYREGNGGKWNFDEDTVLSSMTLTAVYTDELPRAATKLNMNDIGESAAVLDGVNAAVVIFVGFTDGYHPDHTKFENYFTAEYGQKQALGSLSTYYDYNSYGKVSFDYYFYYCDTGMSCKEAFDYTLDENIGHKLLYDAFYEYQKNYEGDLKDWDRNGDGYVDLLYFVTGENSGKTAAKGEHRYIYGNATPTENFKPDPEKPVIHRFSKVTYEEWLTPLKPSIQSGGIRILLHETGHLFGLQDYYDIRPYQDEETIDTLGMFDMQCFNFGDWNVYSRFSCGWLEPYVIDGTKEEVTVKLGCSSEVPDALLIPTGAGWNGTAFDEYILIDVLAPYAADGYDWRMIYDDVPGIKASDPRRYGGVRVYHVDSRLARVDQSDMASNCPATTYEELLQTIQDPDFKNGIWLWNRFYTSNGIDPLLPEDSRFCHLIEVVPSDGSSRFRRDGNRKMDWQTIDSLTVEDLYGPGDVFSIEKCADAFVNAPLMNNGSALDYEVEVNFYDRFTHEAIVTIRKIH